MPTARSKPRCARRWRASGPTTRFSAKSSAGQPTFAGRQWVIDPIDGTKNFVRGVPVWATLIALLDDGVPVAGVVSAPALHRRWWAAQRRRRLRGGRRRLASPALGVLGGRAGVGEPVVLQPVGLGRPRSARPLHRADRRRLAGARLRRLLVLLPGGRGCRRHRRRTRGLAVGSGAARHPGARGGRHVHQPRRQVGPHGGSAVATNGLLHDAGT